MQKLTLGFLTGVALWAAPALAQVPNFPQTLPANTVVGRLGIGPGPSEALPFGAIANSAAFVTSSWAIAGGTADAITATLSPAILNLVDGQLVYFRAIAANTSATPTFSPSGLTPHTITKQGGLVLAAGDIARANAEVILRYNLANTRWEILNPPAAGGGGGGSGTVNGGSSGQIAYYASTSNAVSGNSGFNISGTDLTIGALGASVGTLAFTNTTSGTVKLTPPAGALASSVLTLPARTANVATTNGTLTNGNCAKFDANGNIVDNGSVCAGGGVTVNSGTTGQSAYYSGTSAISGNANITYSAGVVTLGQAGSVVGTTAYANATSGTIQVIPVTGALGSSVLTLPARTSNFATTTGAATNGNCAKFDAVGNLVDNGAPCAGGAATLAVGSTSVTLGTSGRVLFDNAGTLGEYVISGSGNVAMTTSPTFTTPTLGVATATTLNGNTFTTGTYTLTGTAAKTLTFNNSITLAGTDATTWTGPSTNATLAALNITDQSVTGGTLAQTLMNSSGNITIDCGSRPYQNIINTGAFTITAPTNAAPNDGSGCGVQVINGPSAGAVTLAGFSGKSPRGDTFATTATLTSATVTCTTANPAVCTWTAGGVTNGSPVYFTAGTIPSAAALNTVYYAANVSGNTWNFSATPGGTNINGSGSSGNLSVTLPSVFHLNIQRIATLSVGIWNQAQ